MARQVPIGIFNVAKTVVNRDEVKRWLKFVGVSDEYELPEDGGVSNPALLIALAAKRCYKSFEVNKSLNPNLTQIRSDWGEYLDNVMKVGHGCYDAETDVLTSLGWKAWPEVTKDDVLATLDKSGALVYVKPLAVKSFDHRGRMYRVESNGVDLLVTPNHKMYVCATTTRLGRKRDFFSLVEASQLGTISHAYTKIADRWEPREPHPHSVNFLRFLGFAIGDGSYESGFRVRFRLRRPRKVAWLRQVVKALAAEQVGQWAIEFDGRDRYTVKIAESAVDTVKRIYCDGEKCIPQHVLMTAEREPLDGLLEGLMQSDGHEGSTGDSFDTTSPRLADQVQQLCLHCGIAANVCYVLDQSRRESVYGDKPLTRLSILSRNLKPEVNRYAGQEGKSYWVEDWSGEVFCAQMPDDTQHVLYVRRGGKPVWCGNSVLEHSVFTFAFENVSRVFTGEMNRHRAGWAISEGSMRFIRFSEDVPYWEPDCIQGPNVLDRADQIPFDEFDYADLRDAMTRTGNGVEQRLVLPTVDAKKEATRILFARHFDNMRDWYGILELIWADELAPASTFGQKKELTSLFRRGIGMGCATGGVWSGNVRALRHVLTMRCEPAAEEEILHVFSRVAVMMKEEEPMLFGDFQKDEKGFWRPRYRKV